jgi:hypothetical protein
MLGGPWRCLPIHAALVVASVVGQAGVAHAGEPPTAVLEFRHDAGATCPTEAELRREVAEKVGYDPFRTNAPRVLSIHVSGSGPYSGDLVLRDATGHEVGRRKLEDADCAALRDSLVLAITLGLDPLALLRRPETETKTEAVTAQVAPSESALPALPAVRVDIAGATFAKEQASPAESEPRTPLLVRVAVGALVAAGLTPGDVVGPSGAVGLRYGRLGVDIEGSTTLSGASTTDSGGATATATTGTLLPCYRFWRSGSFGSDLCGTFTGGALFSRGTDVSRADSRTDAILSAGLRLAADWRFTRVLGLGFFVQGAIPLEHNELSVAVSGASQVVWKTPSAAATGGLSVFALFP